MSESNQIKDYGGLVTVRHQNGVAQVALNDLRKKNSLGSEMTDALLEALSDVEANLDMRAVVLSSNSDYFSSGADLIELSRSIDDRHKVFRIHDKLLNLMHRIDRLRVPVIAAINGPAIGGGAELALACDFRLMAERSLLSFPEIRFGIMPGAGGVARLARLVGREKAMFFQMTGASISAEVAVAERLVLKAVAAEVLASESNALAEKIASFPSAAIEFIKRSNRLCLDMPLESALEHCQASVMVLGATLDAREKILGFAKKA